MTTRIKHRVDFLLVCGLGVIAEALGRKFFSNYDINYLVYGARLFMEQSAPWMNVWPALDVVHGSLGRLLGTPESAILVVGLAINVGACLMVNEIFRNLQAPRQYKYAAVITTALFFKSTLGGWTADHFSFLVGISSGILFIIDGFRISRRVCFCLGASLGLGLLLKLNSFTTSFGLTIFWILFSSLLLKKSYGYSLKKSSPRLVASTVAGLASTALLIHSLLLFKIELYLPTLKTYLIASQSTASGQFGIERLAMIPLQVNIIEALVSGQLGVLSFAPLVVLFWVCLCRSTWIVFFSHDSRQRERHSAAILLLLASSFAALSLGRGLTHRLFLLPSGCILSASDVLRIRYWNDFFPAVFSIYMSFVWGLFAFVQRDFERDRYYSLRDLLSDRSIGSRICLSGNTKENASDVSTNGSARSNTLLFKRVGKPRGISLQCWSREYIKQQFAGFMHTEELANSIGITFQNHNALDGDYFEKWDWRKTLPEVREKWVNDNASYVNSRRIGYFIERINIIPEEYGAPGYAKNIIPRKRQLRLLTEKTGAELVGKLGRFSLWKTRWANS